MRPPDWYDSARCLAEDPELFFSDGRPKEASRRVCAQCQVREQCLERALDSPWRPTGMWAGLSEKQLTPLWRRRHPNPIATHESIQRLLGLT